MVCTWFGLQGGLVIIRAKYGPHAAIEDSIRHSRQLRLAHQQHGGQQQQQQDQQQQQQDLHPNHPPPQQPQAAPPAGAEHLYCCLGLSLCGIECMHFGLISVSTTLFHLAAISAKYAGPAYSTEGRSSQPATQLCAGCSC